MSIQDKSASFDAVVKASVGALSALMERAATDAREAASFVDDGNSDAAIGTIVDFDRLLADAVALHTVAIAAHRRARE